ncbi:MAG: Calx-beta domain-containing protein, partial [Acidimicrobiia bacterium]
MGSVRKAVRVGVAATIVTTGVVWEIGPVEAASFTQIPTRLYMAPGGDPNILDGIAAFVGVDVGTLEFDGDQDPISGDLRQIVVEAAIGDEGCDLVDLDETDPLNAGKSDYDIDDCPRVQMRVDHGTLFMGAVTVDDIDNPDGTPNPAAPVYLLPSGVVTDTDYGSGASVVNINGTPDQLNDALASLVYTPDPDYYYVGSFNPEELEITVVPGNGDDPNPVESTDSETRFVEIRVLAPNQAATIDGPSYRSADPGVVLQMPAVAPGLAWPYAGSEWTVADPDNDEVVDDDTGETLPDGTGVKMLLVAYLDCGVPTEDGVTGFRLRGGQFDTTDQDIERLLADFYAVASPPPAFADAIGALLDALNDIAPGLTTLTLATSDPTAYTNLFAGIGQDIDEVAYALSQVSFLSNAPSDTCTLYTVVSDLGNNGLPLQYLGDPPTGIEVPFLGIPPIDVVETQIEVGDLQQIDVSFDPASQTVGEGDTATATIVIDPPTHPAFDLRWSTAETGIDPATGDVDFDAETDVVISVPENAGSVQISTAIIDDGDLDPDETFRFELTVPTDPPGSPSGFTRPLGYEIVSTQPTHTVTIQDDDQQRTASISDASVLEGDAGTTNLVVDVTLDLPAKGTETLTVSTADGSAEVGDSDYVALTNEPVSFGPDVSTVQVIVEVNGDIDVEPDETFTVTLAAVSNVSIGDGTATGTITNDDGVIGVSIDDVTVTEGDAGTTNLVVDVTLDLPAKGTETLTVSTA